MFDLQGLNIYLIGMMGCGKSTIGPLLADRLGYNFLDTDTTLAKSCATPLGYDFDNTELSESELIAKIISELFQTVGEPEFRQIETQVLAEVSAYTRLVVATGGGIAIERENWNHLHQGLVIWLDPSLDLLVERLQGDTSRPILANSTDLRATLDLKLAERRHRYAEADIHLPFSDNLLAEEIVERIFTAIPTVLKTPTSESTSAP
ncbi:shikimate kinase [Chamaesiphon polymorphus CCALA 037]|uniref:Shikimate kinase n=1 Tax=Chamaesiphon polymorphus CCALA 037 TaxID=2107692 RepID=A0A2T1GLG9_9CYAN|nr:shikimate kinase [Chamaesiphon polymorphus CCALA 037]